MPPDPDKPRRASTQGDRDRRRSDTAGQTAGSPVFVAEEVTGRYEGKELERRREDRDLEERLRLADGARDDIRELRSDAKKVGERVAAHHEAIEACLKPLAAKLPGQLEEIRRAQALLNAAVEAAVESSNEFTASISHQLQGHHVRIEKVEAESRASVSQIATVERTASEARSIATDATARLTKLEKRSAAQGADLRRFWRRHLGKALAGALTLIAGAIAGAISAHFGGH